MDSGPLDSDVPGKTTAQLLELTYSELRALAQSKLNGEKSGHTLQATALVHEVYLRFSKSERPWASRRHFFFAAAEAMRRILIENARRKSTLRRNGGIRVTLLDEREISSEEASELVVKVDAALQALENQDPKKAQLVRLRFYAGLSLEEAADISGYSLATAKRHWQYARAWLHRYITENHDVAESEEN
ncbi:ECF-type sigma factor [Luteolibacter luteus]|uniref:Sigma-70 family RNA polymerase sigma factor n=1 Tax=Luteolibacter luteus TaxID=2728835 RepID=A0A858RP37_9BACT|nr:ECF-type sigma factor [Luteolibacter luteus]QJE98622.1 sigma-70 family RNA polymerase sigma factor [Luteolibacter luteus]